MNRTFQAFKLRPLDWKVFKIIQNTQMIPTLDGPLLLTQTQTKTFTQLTG